MTKMQENYNRGIKTLVAWTISDALHGVECKETRNRIIAKELSFQKNNISSEERNALGKRFAVLSDDPSATLNDFKAVAHGRSPSDLSISAKNMVVLNTKSNQHTIV